MSMARRINELLWELNMTQKELAQVAGITESTVSHYAKGDRIPRGVNLKKIASALGTSTDYLLGRSGQENHQEEIRTVKTLIARNAAQMSSDERMELVKMLLEGK